MIICHEGKKRTSTHFQDIFRHHILRPSIVAKMIMTGRYRVTGLFFSSSVFYSFAFVPQSGKVEKSPRYKGIMNSAVPDFDIFVRNRLPHYIQMRINS